VLLKLGELAAREQHRAVSQRVPHWRNGGDHPEAQYDQQVRQAEQTARARLGHRAVVK
jgi:hypothetical protein